MDQKKLQERNKQIIKAVQQQFDFFAAREYRRGKISLFGLTKRQTVRIIGQKEFQKARAKGNLLQQVAHNKFSEEEGK